MEQASLKPGSILDARYRIKCLLRESEDGFIYDALNLSDGKNVRIKEYFPDFCQREDGGNTVSCTEDKVSLFEMSKERFLKAARTIKDFRNVPGIVRIRDYFKVNGTVCCAIERTCGTLLSDKLKSEPEGHMSLEDAFRGMIPVLEGLREMHRAGILYRHIRPESMEVSAEGLFSLSDFGIPKFFGKDKNADDVQDKPDADAAAGQIVTRLSAFGSDAFTPPERMDEETRQGPWSDLYSVSAVLYLCVTGRKPESAYERTLGEELTPPQKLNVHMDTALWEIIKKGLAVNAAERYQSAEEMLGDIEKIFPKETDPGKKNVWKKRILILAAAAAAALWLFGIFYYFHPALFKFGSAETETIRIRPAKDADPDSLDSDWAVIRKRAEILAGEDGYVWQKRGREVLLILPESLFSEEGSRALIAYYLLDPWKMSTWTDASGTEHEASLKNAEIKTGVMPGMAEYLAYSSRTSNADEAELEKRLSEFGYYLRLEADPDEISVLRTCLDSFKDQSDTEYGSDEARALAAADTYWLVKDKRLYGNEDQAYYELRSFGIDRVTVPIHFDDDETHIEAAGPINSLSYARLLAYNLTHKGPVNTFYAAAEQKAIWDKPGRGDQRGRYQKNKDAKIDNPVLLTYLSTWSDEAGSAELRQKMSDFKDMLDVLKTPYLIGVSRDNKKEIIVKINEKKIPAFYAEELNYGVTASVGCRWSNTYDTPDSIQGIKAKDGKQFIRVTFDSPFRSDDIQEKIALAAGGGASKVRLLIGSTAAAEGALSDQTQLEDGILDFDRILLPGISDADMERVSICLEKLDNAENSETRYELIGTQKVDDMGLPARNQKDLSYGSWKFLSEEEIAYAKSLAEKYDMNLDCVEDISSHSIYFSNYSVLSENEKASGTSGFIRYSAEAIEDIISGILENTNIGDIFWNSVEVNMYSADRRFRVRASLMPKDEITYMYNLNADTDETSRIFDEAQTKFGQLAVNGTVYEYKEGASENTYLSLNAAAEDADEYPAAAKMKKYIDENNFFQQYGGSDTWEYCVMPEK